ncbi:MAG TPA: phosphoglycerate mutase family protein [Pyrinomonadaceae bacterium]
MTIATLGLGAAAHSQNKTIVLVRHAEKAGETAMDKTGDPDLSPEGQARAKRLLDLVKKYQPHEIYATAYRRVQETVEPIAAYRHKKVQIYDTREQAKFVEQIMASKTEHYLVAGHSNNIPELVNLLAKKDIFKQLPDAEYGVIYVVKIRKGQFKRVEVYEY